MKRIFIATIVILISTLCASSTTWAALTQTQVSQFYVSIFGRTSEGEGNLYWQTNQPDMTTTASHMLSTEAARTYFGPTLSNSQTFIEHIYLNTLGKTFIDDPDGIAYWTNKLINGASKGEVVVGLIQAAQDSVNAGNAQDQFNNKVEVSNFIADNVFSFTGSYEQFSGYTKSITHEYSTVLNIKYSFTDPLQIDTLQTHQPDDAIDYYWFTYLPSGLNKTSVTYIVVEGNAGIQSNNYDEVVENAKMGANNPIAEKLKEAGIIYLRPVFPSPSNIVANVDDYSLYPQGLYRGSFVTSTNFKKRPDLRLNKMIDRYKTVLRNNGYNIADKVFMYGFSISGAFTIHYAMLHPERLKAIAPGSPGFMTIPEETYKGTVVNWPVGIADLKSLSDISFNFNEFKKIKMFLWIGDQDTTTPVMGGVEEEDWFPGADDWFPSGGTFLMSQTNFIHDQFGITGSSRGEDQVEIMTNSTNYYSSLGVQIQLKVYPGVAHTWGSTMPEDVVQFFINNK